MKEQMKELQKLKGIGEVLSRRLVESSYDTIAKVAAAEEKGLERVAGMNPQKVPVHRNPSQEDDGGSQKTRHMVEGQKRRVDPSRNRCRTSLNVRDRSKEKGFRKARKRMAHSGALFRGSWSKLTRTWKNKWNPSTPVR